MGTRLYVGNLPYRVREDELRQLFAQAGAVQDVSLPTERETGRPRGFGFIEMADDEGAQKAIQMFNGYTMGDRQLTVNEARPQERREGGRGGYGGGSRGGYGGGGRGGRGGYGGRGGRDYS
jgi:RNA recognition motif-containing protein